MKQNLFVEFQQHSQDFLRLLGEKQRQAGRSKQAADELSIMEFFWDGCEEIFKKYEALLQMERISKVNEHAKAHLLQLELRSVYNEIYLVSKGKQTVPEALNKFLNRTVLPSSEDLKKDVNIRMNGGPEDK